MNYYYELFSANSLKCHVNEAGADPKEVTCPKTDNAFCLHYDMGGKISRKCVGPKGEDGQDRKEVCMKSPTMTACLCKADNCNKNCAADSCKDVEQPASRQAVEKPQVCDAKCKSDGEDPGTDPKPTEQPNSATGGNNGETPDSEQPNSATGGNNGETPDSATGGNNGEDTNAPNAETDDAVTGKSESGTGATEKSGCQSIANSFEKIFLFWILASLVTFIRINLM